MLIGRREAFKCRWSDCVNPPETLNGAELLAHVISAHLPPSTTPETATPCKWGTCSTTKSTKSHIATHIPPPLDETKEAGHTNITVHPSTPYSQLKSPFITFRAPPPLPADVRLRYDMLTTPVDHRRSPTGEGFAASLILRNLARALKAEIAQAEGEEGGLGSLGKKKRQLETGEAFGLPAPPGYVEAMFGGDLSISLTEEERERAKTAFVVTVEQKVLQMIQDGGGGGLSSVLASCVGFSAAGEDLI